MSELTKKIRVKKLTEAEWIPNYNLWNVQTGLKCSHCGYIVSKEESVCRWCKCKMKN